MTELANDNDTTMADATATETTLCGNDDGGSSCGPCALTAGHEDDHEDADGRRWQNYGPLKHYEIAWKDGKTTTVRAHFTAVQGSAVQTFNQVISGVYTLVLTVGLYAIRYVRLLTPDEYEQSIRRDERAKQAAALRSQADYVGVKTIVAEWLESQNADG